jgi:molecular chaperone DnaK
MADEKRRAPRVAAELNLKLAYGSVDEFIERYALNISRGGIFVRTLDPQPPGTPVAINIEIGTGERVVRGRGIVTWTSLPSAPGEPERAPGMGIRFTQLDPQSRALIDLVVATRGGEGSSDEPPRPPGGHAAQAGEAVDVREILADGLAEPPPAQPAAASQPAAAPRPSAEPPPRAPTRQPAPASSPPSEPGPAPGPFEPPPASRTPAPAPRAGPAARPAPKASRKSKVVGIDLGTTNSCVAFAQGGKAEVLASKQGYRTIPSVVAYDAQGRLLVGHPAKAQMIVNPKNTVYGSKRLVGRPFTSPTVQACRDRFHYDIVEGPNREAAVRFAGREFSLQQVAAIILGEMRQMASQALGEDVGRAVVTVPAYYNDHQRNAVREAGALAGLEVVRIVNEPTAAALAFGFGKGLEKRVLVYDLGGGTFDASVLEIQGDVYEVVSTGGDTFLGGVDFDGQLVDHLVYRFMERNGFAPPEDRVAWQRIRDAAEDTKIALSSRDVAVAHVPYLCKDAQGSDVDLQVDVSRAEMDGLTEHLVDRSIAVALEVLSAKGMTKGDVQEVLLVGGQSRMPLVWRKIREAFDREPSKGVHPDEAVAVGAALLADSEARIDSVVLIDVLAIGIGVGLPGGRMAPVLPRNTRLPAKKAYELATTRDGQTELELAVFQGDSPKASECEYLGTVRVENLPGRPRGEVKVAVEFALGAEGILNVTARNLVTGQVTEVQFATVDTPDSLREKLQIPEPQTAPKGARPIEVAPAGAAGGAPAGTAAKKGLFGRLFGRK